MAAPLARIAGVAGAYAIDVTTGIGLGAGGIAGGYVRKWLKRQEWYTSNIEPMFKEWSPIVAGILTGVAFMLAVRFFRERLPEWLTYIVTGVIAGFAAETGRILAGDTEIYAAGKRKILAKNVGTVQKVIVDGNDVTQNCSISGEEVTLPDTIEKGVHKIIVVGTDKAAYEELYVPA